MDKSAIKKYAVWARRELIERITQKALQYGITENKIIDGSIDSIDGKLLTDVEKKQRYDLIKQIEKKGFNQVIEEVAYTWFNRFCALRFMEVNGYLPTHIRVFTDDENNFKPQILSEAIYLDLEGLDINKVYEYKENNEIEKLYKYLLIVQCNSLNKILPKIFPKINDYTQLLLPDNLLREGSIIDKMISLIPESNWINGVEIMGWLYQYYNTEQNELVYDGTFSKKRIPKELLSAATTIYTPDWVVRYMVENSLGKLWIEGHDSKNLKEKWEYYLDEIEQDKLTKENLKEIRNDYKNISPEQISIIDPCMGSGHILVYAFDVLIQIYQDEGYSIKDAVKSIVKNNLYGLDIDKRASQIAYFSIMMRARKYDNVFFSRNIQANVYEIVESNNIDSKVIDYFNNNNSKLKENIQVLLENMNDAKEYGSIILIDKIDFNTLYNRIYEIKDEINIYKDAVLNELLPIITIADILSRKYDVCITNPPYLSKSRFSLKLDKYVSKNYVCEKNDLSMVIFKRILDGFSKNNGFISLITTTSWMFLSSFEKLRRYIIDNFDFESIVDFGTELFEGKVGHNPIVAWVNRNTYTNKNIIGIRLVEYCYSRKNEKKIEFFNKKNYFIQRQDNLKQIPGAPLTYWIEENFIKCFKKGKRIDSFSYPKQGLATGDNNRFLRLWFEVENDKIAFNCSTREQALEIRKKWFPYNKGGGYRKWYGNNEYIINWEMDGFELCNFKGSVIRSPQYYFREGLSWCKVTSGNFSMRYIPEGFLFDVAGCTLFTNEKDKYYLLGFMNSNVNEKILRFISPTLNYEVGHIASLPIIYDTKYMQEIEVLVKENIKLCKDEWDLYENSWNFCYNPLTKEKGNLREIYIDYSKKKVNNFCKLKNNEIRLNQIFSMIYEVDNLIDINIDDNSIVIEFADYCKDIKRLISYAVGCMFGRYSLDIEGLVYAGGEFDESKYKTFEVDKDNIIPICDDEYFEGDIVGRFINFVEVVYGSETLEENLKFISDALGGNGTPREVIRKYFLNDFFKDHCSTYSVTGSGKRPIYWLFDSGKKNGFKALMYMHRYKPDTIARLRTDYVHEQQSRYRNAIENIEKDIENASRSEKVKLNKKLNKLKAQEIEIREYEEKVHHLADQMISIDLDDGVKHNYEIFKDILAKIK